MFYRSPLARWAGVLRQAQEERINQTLQGQYFLSRLIKNKKIKSKAS